MANKYIGICANRGKVVRAEDALDYALDDLGIMAIPGRELDAEFRAALVDWFYSGSWMEVETK